jgi:hypothetical protein
MKRSPSVHKTTLSFIALLSMALAASPAVAQIPGLPVLQNGFSNPGITVAANYGTAEDLRGYALAGAWAPASGRLQLSAGVGGYDPKEEPDDEKAWLAYGGRVAVPLTRLTGTGRFGVAPFVGIGGASRDDVAILHVPVGVAAGYRFALGQTRAVSAYLSSFYGWTRATTGDESASNGLFRISAGIDFAVTKSIGLSAGYETGAEADETEPGPRAPLFGIGLSYAFGR